MDYKGRILIIDDNPKNIQLLGNILSDNSFDVEIALGGYEALEWLKEELFDLILLDVMMPEINGFEVCEKIRQDKKHQNVPIIFITAKTDKSSIIRGFNSGGQDYIAKPFDTSELLARVNTQIELKKNKEELLTINLQLEEKVAQRTKQLEASNQQLVFLDESKNKFLSFIGKEVRKPLLELDNVVNLIKHSAESSKLFKLTNTLEVSVDKLKFITTLASQITKFNEKETINTETIHINNIVEHILIDMNKSFQEQNLEISNNINSDISITGNKELIKNSLTCMLELICLCSSDSKEVTFSSELNENDINIKANISPCSIDYKDVNNTPESSSLYLSYSELVMSFHQGRFFIDNENNQSTINWNFPSI